MIIGSKPTITFGGLVVTAIDDLRASLGDLSTSMNDSSSCMRGCVTHIQFLDAAINCRFLSSKKARIRNKWWKRLSRKYEGYISGMRFAHQKTLHEPQVMSLNMKWDVSPPPGFLRYDERA